MKVESINLVEKSLDYIVSDKTCTARDKNAHTDLFFVS